MALTYFIIGVLCVVPFAYFISKAMEAEEGPEYGISAFLGLIGAVFWPLVLLLGGIVLGVKSLEKLSNGSRVQITWRNK